MATNRADTLDPALLRPGRLDRKIEFPLPDRRQKRLVFQVWGDSAALRSYCHLPACCLPRNAVKHGDLLLLQQLSPAPRWRSQGRQAGREGCCPAVSPCMLLHGGLPSIRITRTGDCAYVKCCLLDDVCAWTMNVLACPKSTKLLMHARACVLITLMPILACVLITPSA